MEEVKREQERVNSYLRIERNGVLSVYRLRFRSLNDIALYLERYPQVNKEIFDTQNSVRGSEAFAGAPLEKAIEYLSGGYDKAFDQFLELKKEIDRLNRRASMERRAVPSVVGSRPNVPAYIAGAPKTMYRMKSIGEKKFATIYVDLSYPSKTTEQQIMNRGILILNLVTLLERSGMGVNLKVFQSCYVGKEALHAEIDLKQPDEQLNVRKCYYPMCGKEFLRRIMARVLESLPVKENWGFSYGMLMSESMRETFLGAPDPKGIYIYSPQEMGIKGKNLADDANAFLEKLELDEEISLPVYKKES